MGASKPATGSGSLSHNLVGQRLGRKGRDTRDRIVEATERLLADPDGAAISLSAVAREASLSMPALYLYFGDLTELLLAVLNPIMASAETSYLADLRTRWRDEELHAHCLAFVAAFHAFWQRHTRALHLRNSFADANDARMREHRIEASRVLIQLLVGQMDGDPAAPRSLASTMATVLLTGIERLVTVTTDVNFSSLPVADPAGHLRDMLEGEAHLLALAIRERRGAL